MCCHFGLVVLTSIFDPYLTRGSYFRFADFVLQNIFIVTVC